MPDDFDIPELNRIGDMMDDLMANDRQPVVANTRSRTSTPVRRRAVKQRRRFASWTISQFAEGANWTNQSGFRSALSTNSRGGFARLGCVTVGKYSESVNWRNAIDGPQLSLSIGDGTADSGPPETVQGFFDDMGFE